MRFVVIFDEGEEMQPVREALAPAYLAQHRHEIRMAGGLRNHHGGVFVGGLWVFEVASRERAIELIERDPFYMAMPRPYRLLAWDIALPQYDVLT